ncbi:hypothetical protein KI387_027745, partial [Taxus chinensis]
ILFIKRHIESIKPDRLPVDFEVVFPELLKEAHLLKLDLPYHLTCLKRIKSGQEKRLSKYWNQNLIGDLNTAALGFRTLRLNGYDVSP